MPDDIGWFVGPYFQVLAALGASLLVVAVIPLALLLTAQSRREFGVA